MQRSRKERDGNMSELLEKILSDENIAMAQKKVYSKKGAHGVDGVTVQDLSKYMDENWTRISQEIRDRKYRPQPVMRVEIPKPNGGVRKLGIPTVMDRVIEQAIVQVLNPICEPHFSEYSYGFRPGRCAQQAIVKLLEYFNDGNIWIVDIDLEKFFDNVPQGGNLSPLLSNIMLNELDKELEGRGLRFTRYADDCVIVVKSEASAKRVMRTITAWIERKLGLKVNATKTCVTKPGKLKYLGFGFWKGKDGWKARAHQDSIQRFKLKLKALCKRSWSIDMDARIDKLNLAIRGWINNFAIADMRANMRRLDEHLRVMIRVVIWKQWKVPKRREWGLKKLGVNQNDANGYSYIKGYMKAVRTPAVKIAISKEILTRRGLVSIEDYYLKQHNRKRHVLKLS